MMDDVINNVDHFHWWIQYSDIWHHFQNVLLPHGGYFEGIFSAFILEYQPAAGHWGFICKCIYILGVLCLIQESKIVVTLPCPRSHEHAGVIIIILPYSLIANTRLFQTHQSITDIMKIRVFLCVCSIVVIK